MINLDKDDKLAIDRKDDSSIVKQVSPCFSPLELTLPGPILVIEAEASSCAIFELAPRDQTQVTVLDNERSGKHLESLQRYFENTLNNDSCVRELRLAGPG